MSNFTPFPQPIDSGDGNLDRSQDEATFQREQQEAAELAESEQSDSPYDDPIDYYGADLRYQDYEPSPYDGTYSEM